MTKKRLVRATGLATCMCMFITAQSAYSQSERAKKAYSEMEHAKKAGMSVSPTMAVPIEAQAVKALPASAVPDGRLSSTGPVPQKNVPDFSSLLSNTRPSKAGDPGSGGGGAPEGGCPGDAVTAPITVTGDTCGALNDCTLRPSEDIIYEVTIPTAGLWTFSTCGGATWDTYLYLGTTCCSGDIAINDDFCGLQSTIAVTLSPGVYYLTLEAFGSTACGAYSLSILPPPPPCTIDCTGTTPEGEPCLVNNDVDTINGGCNSTPPVFTDSPCPASWCGIASTYTSPLGDTRDTDWYRITLNAQTQVTATLTSQFNGVLFIVDGIPACAPVVVATATSNDCVPGTATACLQPGMYVVFVAPAVFSGVPCGSGDNDYRLDIACESPCPPSGIPNDNCIDRIDITDGTTSYDTTGANTDGPVEVGCQFDGQTYHDIWYNYEATCTGILTVSTCNQASYDTDLVVYDGCDCSSLVRLGCNDDGPGCAGFSSIVQVPVTQGNCYKIRVGGWQAGDQGAGNLTITCQVPGDCTCHPGDIVEGEANCGLPDSFNGGCNSTPNVYSTINCGETVCGTMAAAGGTRDTDWYEACISDTTDLTWCVSSDLPAAIFIINGSCPPTILASGTTGAACIETCITLTGAAPGRYHFFVAPTVFDGVPCPTNYRATLTASNPAACVNCNTITGACCLDCGAICTQLTPADCAAQNGAYRGDFVDCASVVCLPNDTCVCRIDITDGTTAFDTTGAATDGPAHPGTCQFDGQTYHDIWYNYEATCTGFLSVSTCNQASYDTDLVVYDGCDCGNLVLLGCNDDGAGCAGFSSSLVVPVTQGNCYKIRVGGWQAGDFGPGNLTLNCFVPGDCTCHPGDVPENELDCGLPTDTVNGGCNSTPNVFSPIQCGQTVCGTYGASGGTRDTDWYELCIDQVTDITWCVSATMGGQFFILNGACPPAILANGTTPVGCAESCITLAGAAPGTYRLFFSATVFDGIACPTDYRATVTVANPAACVPCPCSDGFCCKGDTDGSGDLSGLDVQGMVNAQLVNPECGTLAFCRADVDDNGFIQFADIGPFVALLLAGDPCPVYPDNCVDRLDIFDGVTAFDTTSATTDGPVEAGCQFDGQTYNDIWFNYIATCTGPLLVSTCEGTICDGQNGSAAYDTDLVVYEGCDCSNLVRLGCNDDGPGGVCPGFHSQVVVQVVEGNCYKIRVGGWQAGDSGTGNLLVCCGDLPPGPCEDPNAGDCCVAHAGVGCNNPACCNAICGIDPFCCDVNWDSICASEAQAEPLCNCGGGGPPANDPCASAIALTQGTATAGTTIGATSDGSSTCPGNGAPDVWYSITAASGTSIAVNTCFNPGYDTVLSAHDGCGGAELACNDDDGTCTISGLRSRIVFNMPASGVALIRVAGFGGAFGDFQIIWE